MIGRVLAVALIGVGVAMGQASDEVKRAATFVTTSSEEEGFATAIERYALAGALLSPASA